MLLPGLDHRREAALAENRLHQQQRRADPQNARSTRRPRPGWPGGRADWPRRAAPGAGVSAIGVDREYPRRAKSTSAQCACTAFAPKYKRDRCTAVARKVQALPWKGTPHERRDRADDGGGGLRSAPLARTLVDERLAACVNVLPPMQSIYRWQGQVEVEDERQLVIKTSQDRLVDLQVRLLALHPYDVPEFLVLDGGRRNRGLPDWLREQTKGRDEGRRSVGRREAWGRSGETGCTPSLGNANHGSPLRPHDLQSYDLHPCLTPRRAPATGRRRRSSTSSMPAEMRTRPSVMPMAARRSGGTEACVIVAGCEIRLSTPPRLSASASRRTRLRKRRACSSDPSSNDSIPPKPAICRAASACCGCEGRPG